MLFQFNAFISFNPIYGLIVKLCKMNLSIDTGLNLMIPYKPHSYISIPLEQQQKNASIYHKCFFFPRKTERYIGICKICMDLSGLSLLWIYGLYASAYRCNTIRIQYKKSFHSDSVLLSIYFNWLNDWSKALNRANSMYLYIFVKKYSVYIFTESG